MPLFVSGTKCSVFITQDVPNASQPVIFNPDFFVERLKHEHPQVFTDLVLSNITRLIDLPGDEFAQFTRDSDPKIPTASGFLRSFNFLKRKGQKHRTITVVSHKCPIAVLCYFVLFIFVTFLQSKIIKEKLRKFYSIHYAAFL